MNATDKDRDDVRFLIALASASENPEGGKDAIDMLAQALADARYFRSLLQAAKVEYRVDWKEKDGSYGPGSGVVRTLESAKDYAASAREDHIIQITTITLESIVPAPAGTGEALN